MKELLIIGAGGHGKVVADIAKKCGYNKIAFLDDNTNVKDCNGYKVVGRTKDFIKYDCDMFVAVGNSELRQKICSQLENENKSLITLVHPSAVIGDNVVLGKGTVVMACAVINPSSKIGNGVIINTCASIDHDNIIGDFAHISVGTHLAGLVTVGDNTFIGAGVTVINNIKITTNCTVGAGAVVIKDILEKGTYIGVPARRIDMKKPLKFFGGVEHNCSIVPLYLFEVAA